MPLPAYLLIGAFLVVQLVCVAWLSAMRSRPATPPEPPRKPSESFEVRLAALELTVSGLPSLWEAERTRAEAAANSARTARARAERLTREREAELEADDDVRGDDEGESGSQRVLAMSSRVGSPSEPDDLTRQMMNRSLFSLSPL